MNDIILNKYTNYYCPACQNTLHEEEHYLYCDLHHDICKYNVEISKQYITINIRNIRSNLDIVLDSNKLYINISDELITKTDYKSLQDLQEVLLDLFKIYKKHEENLLFL